MKIADACEQFPTAKDVFELLTDSEVFTLCRETLARGQ